MPLQRLSEAMSNQRSILAPRVRPLRRHGYARAPAVFRSYVSASQPYTRDSIGPSCASADGGSIGMEKRRARARMILLPPLGRRARLLQPAEEIRQQKRLESVPAD